MNRHLVYERDREMQADTPGRSRGRPRLRTDRELIDAYMRIHYDTDPARITLADVAREAGVVPATLVHRFGSKRGLLEAALQMGLTDLRAGLKTACAVAAVGSDPWTALNAVIEVLMPVDRTPTQIANTIAQLHLELSDPDLRPLVVEHMVAVREAFTTVLAAMLDAGQVSGAVGPLAEVVTTAWSGALVRFAIEGEAGDSARGWIARAIADVLE
ncbi:MAG: TetR/AcrR family transcriptional regulator [Thermomicrobiales bacterium]